MNYSEDEALGVNLLEVDLEAGLDVVKITGAKKEEGIFKESVSNNINLTSVLLNLSKNHHELLNIIKVIILKS